MMSLPRVVTTAAALASFAVPAAVYVQSLSAWPQTWDTGEMQVVPYILGIPHPTGFPAFVLLGWLFSHVVVLGSVAWRMNLLCALLMAGVGALTRSLALSLGAGQLSALGATFVFAFSEVAWNKGTHCDVHVLALLLSVLTFLGVSRYCARGRSSWLFAATGVFGFGLATHPNVLWTGTALLVPLASAFRRRPTTAMLALSCVVMPLALYAYLPVRSQIVYAEGLDPATRSPFDGHGEVVWDTNQPRRLKGFLKEVSGSDFGAPQALGSILRISSYPRYAVQWYLKAQRELGLAPLLLALIGIAAVAMTSTSARLGRLGIVLGAFAVVPFAFSYGAESDVVRYLLPSFVLTVAAAAASSLAMPKPRGFSDALTGMILLLAAGRLYSGNTRAYLARYDPGGQPVIDRVRASVPDGSVVLANWIDGTSLAYGAYVEGSLGRRIVLLWNGDDAKRYPVWANDYRIYVLANFALVDEVPKAIPPHCLAEVPEPDPGHRLYEVRCPRPRRHPQE